MTEESFKRKLTAILSADVEGYSRLMGEDEDATIRTLTSYRELMSSLIQKHRGRVVDSPGDNLLAEFLSVVDAVRCAVEIQEELRIRNAELPESRRMHFRIGINLGDVVEEEERIYGDGINIAARVEGLADGGGICISGTVYDSIKNKLTLSYESIGEHTVKNIKEPVRVYRMRVGPEAEVKPRPRRWRRTGLVAVAVLVVAAGAWAIWHFYFRPPPIEPASVEKMAFPLPDKPSIAVLPFDSLSKDQSDAYIADGLSENIISSLSKIPHMLVIARNSTFVYKGKAVRVNQVAEELGVRYVLEGSVQKSEDKIRVIAQLIDAVSGHHLWSEKYDREVKDFFQLLDEITLKIIDALRVKLIRGGDVRTVQTNSFEAWSYYVKGSHHFGRFTKQDNIKARELSKQAIKLDPEYVGAWVLLAWTHLSDARNGFSTSPNESIKQAVLTAQKASAIDDKVSQLQTLWGTLYLIQRQHEKAIAAGQKSIELDPNNTEGYALLAQTIYYSGRSDEAITLIQQAMRLSPYPPAYYLIILGMAYQGAGRYQEAHPVLQKLLDRAQKGEFSPLFANNMLTINYALMGNYKKAREHWAEVLKIYPKASLEWIRGLSFFKDPDQLESLLDAYRAAGISAHPPLPLPDRPSIAVLPFVNMSDDPKQEYLSDGITEQIITSISKIPRLFVISRTSSFKYKGKAVDIKRVGRELGVKYVLEGSVQRSGDRLRITAQLIDALTGKHLWAERYDRDFKDLFALQDEITLKIIQSLSVKLTEGDRARLQSGGTYNLKAVEKIFEAVKYARAFNRESNATARKLYEETIALDPEFAGAYTGLAMTHFMDVQLRASKSPRESYAKATKLLKKAIALDENFGLPHSHLCAIYGMQRQYEKAIAEGEKAVALNPNSDRALEWLGLAMDWMGRPEEAIALYEKAMRLCPFPPSYYYLNLGHAYRSMERYKEAITEYKKALHLTPNNVLAFAGLAICYSSLGQEEEARAAAAELLKINPKFFFKGYVKRLPYKNQALKERWRDALQKAGLK